MPKRTHVQRDFSGGEISPKMLMRAETEAYNRSVLEMTNFQPTLQGGFERSPGSRFLYDAGVPAARVIPYLTPANEPGFVEISEGVIKLRTSVLDTLVTDADASGHMLAVGGVAPLALTTIRKQIVPNGEIKTTGSDPWVMEPEQYVGGAGDPIGLAWSPAFEGVIQGNARIWKPLDTDTLTITNEAVVDVATTNVTFLARLDYITNYANDPDAGYEATIKVGKTPGAADVIDYEYSGIPGSYDKIEMSAALDGGAPWTGTLFIQVQWKATTDKSAPRFQLRYLKIIADGVIDIVDEVIGGETPPWTADELDDIHFVQSPYSADPAATAAVAKQLVLCHPNHIPHMFFFNADASMTLPPTYPNPGDIPVGYVLLQCVFENPPAWSANNYPNTCTSFNGRLILAGAQDAPVLGSPTSPNTETVWGTKVGEWLAFSIDDAVTASDSVEFTTIYRSPLQWAYGQKRLLLGASDMEYSAFADGIFQPADIGVEMHSTHGSVHVQPSGFGKSVLFAGDGGTKVREMMFQNEDQGWVATDLTLLHPDLCASGIRRMVRMRNPHQMLACLLGDGQIALLHQDTQAKLFGWSRLRVTYGTRVKDICVVSNTEGVDMLVLFVSRYISGTLKHFVEVIPNWVDGVDWEYMSSTVRYAPSVPTNVLTGLDHLDGKIVQVVSDRDYLGSFKVIGGTVTLLDPEGNALPVSTAVVGLGMAARCRLLPPRSTDPGSSKSYESISLRIRQSTRPLVNNVRPDDRAPVTRMGTSEVLEDFEDVAVTQLGWDIYQVVDIVEYIPLRTEVLGVYGDLAEDNL